MAFQRSIFLLAAVLATEACLVGCSNTPPPGAEPTIVRPDAGAPPSADGGSRTPPTQAESLGPARCLQALSEPLPARLSVMSSDVKQPPPGVDIITMAMIQDKIHSHCAMCHTLTTPFGGFVVAAPSDLLQPGGEGFQTRGEQALHHIRSDGTVQNAPDETMPPFDSPEGKPWNQRVQMFDDIVRLSNWLDAWVKAGYAESFPVPSETMPDTMPQAVAPATYLMAPEVGMGLTNLGNCIPEQRLIASDPDVMDDLDGKFARLERSKLGEGEPYERIGLPQNLSDTDLTTFDSEELAKKGVIAFVPAYPLWSDDAGKLRHVRVPRGQSIHFDKTTQEFVIPRNTRFYKTFLKRIIDTDGNASWRKIETRLIVARGDPDGALAAPQLDLTKISALFGIYRWSDDETQATLVDEPLNDKEGFKDTLIDYDTDVNLAASIRAANAGNLERTNRLLVQARAIRHYAMPSSQRCIQCHMGSTSRDFVLGFRPVQIKHRPVGEGGVIEPSGPDELTQLQRLIDYGVITGVESPSDILPLEELEGDRKPRNDYELTAQGYMLGNCAHCHNPNGFPTVSYPQLRDLLNFMPSAQGGIFQFPLDRTSPRITRGIAGDVQIPYITPSLVDNPSYPPDTDPFAPQDIDLWLPKSLPGDVPAFIYAPWRSLIYRNVETPFAYSDDFALYPHMPMNTPGYDVRAKRILGDWMVSIPAVREHPEIPEYLPPYADGTRTSDLVDPLPSGTIVSDTSPQPYKEVKPGDAGYAVAVSAAEERLATFHSGTQPFETLPPDGVGFANYKGRYAATLDTSDIVDLRVDGVCQLTPPEQEIPTINVPTHPHWVNLDLTQSPAKWVPRRSDWDQVLVSDQVVKPVDTCNNNQDLVAAQYEDQKHVVELLNTRTLDENDGDGRFRDFAMTAVPSGLWKDNPGCNWSGIPTVDEVRAMPNHPAWLDGPGGKDGQAHVYSQTPGNAIFNMICINCHGPKFDSVGRLAENLATMTGGTARVADLRDGLFGPINDPQNPPGTNRAAALLSSKAAGTSAGVDDWWARYMAWMALGGTGVSIPRALLANVAHTLIFGERRGPLVPPKSANMLSIARELCMDSLKTAPYDFSHAGHPEAKYLGDRDHGMPSILWDLGDAEMWMRLCSFNNPPPIVPYLVQDATTLSNVKPVSFDFGNDHFAVADTDWGAAQFRDPVTLLSSNPVLKRCAYASDRCGLHGSAPASAMVGDENGNLSSSLSSDNLRPWCVLRANELRSTAPKDGIDFDAWFSHTCIGGADCNNGSCAGADCIHPPECPVGADTTDEGAWDDAKGSAAREWALKGAMNAGFAVFLYLDDLAKNHGAIAKPTYDHCEQLQP